MYINYSPPLLHCVTEVWFGETNPPPRPAGTGPAEGPRPPAVRTGNTRLEHTDLTQQVNTAEENKIQLPNHLSEEKLFKPGISCR